MNELDWVDTLTEQKRILDSSRNHGMGKRILVLGTASVVKASQTL
jgi:hypothetical protein